MKTRIALVLFFALTAGTLSTRAQFWEKKDWRQWSKDDAKKMLEDSPWAKTWSHGEVRRGEVGGSSEGTGRETEPRVYYAVQLRSALPVRQAVVRLAQINRKYDKMSEADKKAMDEGAERYFARAYGDVIVVNVSFWSNVQFYEKQMNEFWQSFPEGSAPVGLNLLVGKERIAPVRFTAPRGGAYEFEAVFPRVVNGEEIVTPNTKVMQIEFMHPGVGEQETNQRGTTTGAGTSRVYVEFKPEKMTYKGQLIY